MHAKVNTKFTAYRHRPRQLRQHGRLIVKINKKTRRRRQGGCRSLQKNPSSPGRGYDGYDGYGGISRC